MSGPNRLTHYAHTATYHAREQHAVILEAQHPELVDRILDAERAKSNLEHRRSITLCYGAWLGEWAVENAGGKWYGLYEPTPPRICVRGVVCSPMDAIERRLMSEHAPTVVSLCAQLIAWSKLPLDDKLIQSRNRSAWDDKTSDERFVQMDPLPTARHEALAAIDPWLLEDGSLEGRRVLCLAAGGGTHGPLLAIAGAEVTIVDFSTGQLAIDNKIAREYGLQMKTVQSSIDDLSAFHDSSFDLVVQPVSSCYLRDLEQVYAEIARVLRIDGLYVSQHKQPISLQSDFQGTSEGYAIQRPYEEGHLVPPAELPSPYHESGMTEFIHTWDSLVGGLCRSGFAIEDLQEPSRGDVWALVGSPEHRCGFVSPYVKIKARRRRC